MSVANSLGRQKLCSLPRKGHAWFLCSIIKQWNCLLQKIWFPWTQGSSSLTQCTAHAEGVTWPSSHCLCNLESRTWCENYNTLAAVAAASSKLPFVPDPGSPALLPASVKTGGCVYPRSPQACPALWDPVDCSPPGSSVHGFSRQGYWVELPCPSPGDLPNPGIKPLSPMSSTSQADSLLAEPSGKTGRLVYYPVSRVKF